MNYLTLFEESVQKYYDRTVLVDQNGMRKTTYGELDVLSGRIAGKLLAEGVCTGDSVMVLLGRKTEYIASYLGVLKAGGVVVPVIEEYPEERIEYIRQDSQAKQIIQDDFLTDIEDYEPVNSVILEDKSLAMIIYTSGSTGNPKGIEHTVESFCNGIVRNMPLFDLEQVIMTGAAPLSFIVVLAEYFAVFLTGGYTHILSDAVRKDVRALKDYYLLHKITVGFISPQLLRIFQCESPFLKRVLTGSERLSNVYTDKYEIYNVYGMSETASLITFFKVDKKYANSPIGKAADGLEVILLDENGKDVQKGKEGEICVIGHLARGYRNLPEQTRKTFQMLEDGRVLLHTGDCGEIDSNGNLIYLNRKDWMVKINGQRVETQEIEAIICKMEEIASCAVKAFTDENGQTYLVAYYVEKAAIPVEKLRKVLTEKIPEYMVPRFFKKLAAMPVNVNGKLDRKALLPPDISDYKEGYIAPADEVEKAICEGIEVVLKCGKIGVCDDYIRMGGDSIKVLKLAALLSEYQITPDMILRGRTPRGMAEIRRNEKKDIISHHTDVRECYPLTDAQMGVYLECVKKTGTKMYNIPIICKLPEKTDVEKFTEAVRTVIRAHDAFRVTVEYKEESPVMFLHDWEPEIIQKKTENLEQEKRDFVQPFHLEQGPLYRMELCESGNEWYFLMDVHHLIFDGTSLSVFMDEVANTYYGKLPEREKLTLFDISVYEETLKETEAYQKAERYFEKKFDGVESDSAIIPDYYPQKQNGSSKKLLISVHEQLSSAELEPFIKKVGITENTLFLGAFAYTLAKVAGQSDCSFCTVNNGRHDNRLASATGMFVKTLPMYFPIEENTFSKDFLLNVQKDFYDTMSHDCISFGELAAKYHLTPKVTFVYQAEILNGFELYGERVYAEPLETGEAQFDLSVMIMKSHGSYEISLEYRDEIYSEDIIRNFADMMLMVIKGMLYNKKLAEILLIDSETEEIMDSFNRTEVVYEKVSVVEQFRRQVALVPDNPAVVYLDKTYTYAQVDEITERIAGYLKAKGIGREDVVSVLIPRCEYMVIASLGVLKSGAAYQPLDSSYPSERLEFMIQDASAKLLIADRSLMECVPGYDGPVLYLDELSTLPGCDRIEETPAPEDLFILLYTSGSTGVPKGVMLEHHNLTAFCNWYRNFYELTPKSRVAAYASYGFDADMMDLYPALTTGACVHIIDESIRLDLMALNNYFELNGITHSFMTTQVGRQFAAEIENMTLKTLSVGGEKLVPVEPPRDYKLYNVYGPTECTIFITLFPVDKLYHRVPIGKALDNVKLYVVDKEGRRLPPGMPGELWIAGHQVARGYLNRPEQTEKVFIQNPFCQEDGYERVYRTGDIVRFLPDGSIDFIGRNDGQVKIRGFRIELSEVERVIRQYPGIKDATVADFDAAGGGKFLAAYVVSDETIDIDKLNAFILERKPPYMVPAVTMQIDRIPLNQNQKVNRRALPEPVFRTQDSREEISRPQTRLEEKIVEIVKSVVGDMEIGVSSSLINYGLTSINAIGLVSKLSNQFRVELPVMKILDGASVIDIENMIFESWMENGMNGKADASVSENAEDDRKDAYPLTAVQLGVYYDVMKKEADTLYNIPMCFAFEDISVEKLTEAVKAAVKAHSYINIHIELRDGAFMQIRNDELEASVPYTEMSEVEFEEYKSAFVRPFNLQKGPLYRFEIVRTDKRTYLLWDIHHLIFDGFSSGVLLKDIERAYCGEELEPESYTYFDYAQNEESMKDSEEYKESGEYFEQMFKNFESVSEIPGNKAGNMEEGTAGEVFRTIPKAGVDKFCKELQVTPSSYFLAVAFYTVSRFANSRQVYISTIDSGRSSVKMASCLGMFVHTLPLFMNFEEKLSVGDLIRRSNEVMRDSIRNESYPFTEIASKYGYHTDIMYECQLGVTSAEGSLGGIPYENVRMNLDAPKFKTAIAIYENNNDYILSVRYNDALYTEEYMNVLVDSLTTVAGTMLSDREAGVSGISLMSAEEKKRIEGFGLVKSCELPGKLLHKVFEATAEQYPDREALIACDATLTFRELNEMSNIIAWNLIERGVKRGDSIVLLLPRRSFYFAVAFGVLKAGAAFIPCDPEYPTERINHITQDGDARYLITTDEHIAEYPADQVVNIQELLTGDKRNNPDVEVSPEDLAYMIYTSGSTGKPKGVELRHIGICNYIYPDEKNLFYHYVANKLGKIVSVTTISFDMSFKDTVGILCNGKTVVFADEEQMNDPRALSEILRNSGADAFSATPSRILQYMEYAPFLEAVSKCNLVICGGEAYPQTLLSRLRKLGVPNIFNSYGPTEITVSSNMADLTHAEHITVGRPLPNYQEYIVDTDGNPVPHDVIGELIIGGPGVARGYHKLPELTAKNFVEYNGERMYRSGDYAKWDADGNVEILGRLDNQIKLRGLRIELGEIEGLIEKQPDIKKAVVVIRKLSGQDNLCAYFTADREIDVTQLQEELKKHLTHYMVPTAYLQLETIPVTPSGKTNAKALPEPVVAEKGEYIAPVDDVEKYFCEVFERVLKVDRIGAEDDFFQAGGTSLTVTSVVIDASEHGYVLNYGDVFKHTTPRALAKLFREDSPKEGVTGAGNFDQYDYSGINAMLEQNTLSAFRNGESREIGNILLTGATGFMGVHVLAEYLRSETGKAYCLVRKGKFENAGKRLVNTLFYYFGDEFKDIIPERIEAYDGDVTNYDSFEQLKGLPIDTVFNCAASVKHFSKGTDIEDINVGGAKNCVRFCEEMGARLIHFSTISIAGALALTQKSDMKVLDEKSLYYGQRLDNQYTSSKMLSEREVLEAVAERGLDGKVIRVGTLAARESDGEFQMNFLTNSFMGRLRSYLVLKCFPYFMMNQPLRMGPIDTSAKAFMLLAKTPKECTLFHAINNHSIPTVSIVHVMQKNGMDIRMVEDDQFQEALLEAEKDPKKAAILQSMLAYVNAKDAGSVVPVQVSCEYTTQVLARMGFFWNETGEAYVKRFIDALSGLGFFDETNLNR